MSKIPVLRKFPTSVVSGGRVAGALTVEGDLTAESDIVPSSGAIVEGEVSFNTTNGHDHDGSDSKSLPSTSITPHVSRHESGGVDAITLGNLANMGATAIIIDTAANRPAAGTADRLFVDLTNGLIQRDNGTGWDDVTERLSHASSHASGGADALSGTLNVSVTGDADTVDGSHAIDLPNFKNVTTQTANYTASDGDAVNADASGGAITITLPAPVANAWVNVKKIDSSANAVTISQNGTETIDGSASVSTSTQYESITFYSDGTNWFIM